MLLAVFAGGFAGAVGRAGLIEALPYAGTGWPWATFTANVAGALLLGWVVGAGGRRRLSARARQLLGPGLCGALTTFSAMQLELLTMLEAGERALAAGYAVALAAAGLAAVTAGSRLAGGGVR